MSCEAGLSVKLFRAERRANGSFNYKTLDTEPRLRKSIMGADTMLSTDVRRYLPTDSSDEP